MAKGAVLNFSTILISQPLPACRTECNIKIEQSVPVPVFAACDCRFAGYQTATFCAVPQNLTIITAISYGVLDLRACACSIVAHQLNATQNLMTKL